jgi:hypothetical protein
MLSKFNRFQNKKCRASKKKLEENTTKIKQQEMMHGNLGMAPWLLSYF